MPLPQEKRYTLADALTWDESERIELIYLKGKKCKAYLSPFDVRLFETQGDSPDDVDTVLQPDLLVICDEKR